MRFLQHIGNLDESVFGETLENRYAANNKYTNHLISLPSNNVVQWLNYAHSISQESDSRRIQWRSSRCGKRCRRYCLYNADFYPILPIQAKVPSIADSEPKEELNQQKPHWIVRLEFFIWMPFHSTPAFRFICEIVQFAAENRRCKKCAIAYDEHGSLHSWAMFWRWAISCIY